MAIVGVDDITLYAGDSVSSKIMGKVGFGKLVQVLEKSKRNYKDPGIQSEFDRFFWYKISGGDHTGWVIGEGLLHLDTSYQQKSHYTRRFENEQWMPYSIHQAMQHVYKVEEVEEMDPFGGGSTMYSQNTMLPWWGHGFLVALRHADGDETVDGSEEVILIKEKRNNLKKSFANSFETDMLQIVSLYEIEHMFFEDSSSKDIILTAYATDGQAFAAVHVLKLSFADGEYQSEYLFTKETD